MYSPTDISQSCAVATHIDRALEMCWPSYHVQVYRVIASMEICVRPCMCMKFAVRMLADGLLLIMIFFFVFLELSVQIRLCKSWFNGVAATMIHT
jgi:hypothetical protein